jgi:hypothetical protein
MIQSLLDSKAAYLTDEVAVVFFNEPTLVNIDKARKLLDRITDELIKEKINAQPTKS